MKAIFIKGRRKKNILLQATFEEGELRGPEGREWYPTYVQIDMLVRGLKVINTLEELGAHYDDLGRLVMMDKLMASLVDFLPKDFKS